ncbi:hypothetical protein M885DRAFT_521173 [Pelagophyceae sp. CCMP2097]|nr:hypothetical protein M885DRAFT_521173 [Pelagophyceae sp. CCMP2097]
MARGLLACVGTQVRGMTHDFRGCTLPWPEKECKSYAAGLSGVLYALPVLCCANAGEAWLWVVQGLLSCGADYVFIARRSAVHGIDRIFATGMTLRLCVRATTHLSPAFTMWALIAPITCFALAARAKALPSPHVWKAMHCLWHVSGAVVAAFASCRLRAAIDDSGACRADALVDAPWRLGQWVADTLLC